MSQPANGGDGASSGNTGFAHCYRHPNRETGVRCVRCDRPICADCMRPASVGFHCPDDVREAARTVRAPRTSVGARMLASPPYVTVALVVLNIAAYFATGLQRPGTLRDPSGSRLFQDWQEFPYAIHTEGDYYQLLTSAFLHANLLHIAANLLALALIGPPLERLMGWWRFLAVYVLSALGGGMAEYVFGDELTGTVGASGAVFGLFGACLVLVRRLPLDPQWLIATIVLNFAITFSVPNISQLGHLGGFVTGALCALAIGGLPRAAQRVPTRLQAIGLGVVLVVIVVLVAARTAAYT